MRTPRPQAALFAAAIAVATALSVACVALLPRWQAIYAQIGFELPLATRLALGLDGWLLLYPVTVAAAGWLWPVPASRGTAALTYGAISGIVLAIALLWALALPFG